MIETVFDILNEVNEGNFENLPEKNRNCWDFLYKS